MVPLVTTPREVYIGPLGFFFTPIISRLNVHLSSGCVTWALVNRKPDGRMKRSYFGGFLVKPCPTNVTLVIILFHCLAANIKFGMLLYNIKWPKVRRRVGSGHVGYLLFLLPVLITLNISSSATGLT